MSFGLITVSPPNVYGVSPFIRLYTKMHGYLTRFTKYNDLIE